MELAVIEYDLTHSIVGSLGQLPARTSEQIRQCHRIRGILCPDLRFISQILQFLEYALLHLFRSLIGEGHRQDMAMAATLHALALRQTFFVVKMVYAVSIFDAQKQRNILQRKRICLAGPGRSFVYGQVGHGVVRIWWMQIIWLGGCEIVIRVLSASARTEA